MKNILILLVVLSQPSLFCQPEWNWVKPGTPANTFYASSFSGEKIFLIGSGSTLYISPDAGQNWEDLSRNFKPFYAFENGGYSDNRVSFVSENTGFIADERALHKTTDGGRTWSPILSIYPYDLCNIHFINDKTGWVAGYDRFRTTNGGASWIKMTGLPQADGYITGFTAIDPLRVWAFTSFNYETNSGAVIKYSSDGGNTWNKQDAGFTSSADTIYSIVELEMSPSGIGVASVLGHNRVNPGTFQFLIRTTDYGRKWNKISDTGCLYPSLLSITDSLWIAVGNDLWAEGGSCFRTSILRSTDYGESWREVRFPKEYLAPRTAQYIRNKKTIIAAGYLGVIYRSDDFGLNWEEISSLNPAIHTIAFDEESDERNFGIIAGDDGYISVSSDGGLNWNRQANDYLSKETVVASKIRQNRAWISTMSGSLYKSDDFGNRWQRLSTPLDYIYGADKPVIIKDIEFQDSLKGMITASGRIGSNINIPSYTFYTDDGGRSWKAFIMPQRMIAKTVSIINSTSFYVGGLYFPPSQSVGIGLICRTTNLGASWDTNSVPCTINELRMLDLNNGFAGANGAVIVTKDGGRHWTTGFRNSYSVEAIAKEGNGVYWSISGHTLIKSTDNGMTWSNAGLPLPTARNASAVAVSSSGSLFASVENGGFLSTTNALISNAGNIRQDKEEVISAGKFQLFQNYPNPFNPATTISYNIPKADFVNVKVYDLLGREVMTLVNEEQSAGFHTVVFQAQSLSSGIYIYMVKAGEYSETRKMLLMK